MERAHAERLYTRAEAARWKVPLEVFINAVERGAEKAFPGRTPSQTELDRYCDGLHLADLALACACAIGRNDAWDHFVREFRPSMYRAADALDPSGGAREVAESLYAELFGLRERDGIRQSVFRYFHGRSSLSTWLRSLIVQRYVDRHRDTRRLAPLPEDASPAALAAAPPSSDVHRERYLLVMRTALTAAVAALAPRDRLRLACYYAQDMTLAQIARVMREHEATVSRHLSRTRKEIRGDVERRLKVQHGFSQAEIDECFASVVDDAGNLDMADWLGTRTAAESERKELAFDRSTDKDLP
ncbi:MAG TPA: sigma-70 family RNA polymerase sigma factor [Vicinamibacterales bacterium]|nr:sigma-70 family RNA polymerase sigma factor [Vicinamibacterales bacterium]